MAIKIDNQLKETVYSPDSALSNPARLLSGMFRDLAGSRELAWRLFMRNISARYRQTMFGYLWAVLPPLLTSAIWIFLNNQQIMSIGKTNVPYPLYVFTGTILWQVFVNSINTPMRVVQESANMIAKINFPREALIIAALLEVVFNLVIQLCLLACVFFYFHVSLTFQSLWAVPGICSIIAAGMMVGIVLTPLAVLYGDVQHSLPMILQPLFYLTPIVYSAPEKGLGAILATLNPISPLIRFTREVMTTGSIVCLNATLVVSFVTFLLFAFGWVLYRVAMPRLIERISS